MYSSGQGHPEMASTGIGQVVIYPEIRPFSVVYIKHELTIFLETLLKLKLHCGATFPVICKA